MCNIHQNGWRITRDTQPERMVLPLESCRNNKSYRNPKGYCFSEIDDRKPFQVVWIPAWPPPLNGACISLTLNQVHSLVRIYHRAIPWRFHNLLQFYSIGVCVSLISSEYPTWCRSTLKSCGHDLNCALIYPSCPNVPEKIIFERANVWFSLEVLAR
jgi:hypothetical protein